jgi:hypothetical protein
MARQLPALQSMTPPVDETKVNIPTHGTANSALIETLAMNTGLQSNCTSMAELIPSGNKIPR